MLASLRVLAVVIGVGVGTLAAAAFQVVSWGAATLIGAENPGAVGLAAGIVVGLGAGGFAAGMTSPWQHRFHGSVTGMMMAAIIVAISRLGGSPAPTPTVILLAIFAIIVGGAGGVLGGSRRRKRDSARDDADSGQ